MEPVARARSHRDQPRQVIASVGLWWPAADEDKLRQAATAWDDMATAIDAAQTGSRGAASRATAMWRGEAATHFGGTATQLTTALGTDAAAARDLAGALRQYADAVAEAKRKVEELAVTVGASLVVGAALAFFTFGVSEAAAAGVTGGLISAAEAIGVGLSETVAAIAGSAIAGIGVGALEGMVVDAAVTQPLRVEVFHDGGYSPAELGSSALFGGAAGGIGGGVFGGVAARTTARTAAGDLSGLRASGGRIRAAIDPENWGPQGGRYRVGVQQDAGAFSQEERSVADVLAGEGQSVRARPESTVPGLRSPDAIVRTALDDPGTYTEFKTLTTPSTRAIKDAVVKAGKQLDPDGNGAVVVDARAVAMTKEAAEAGLSRAVGQAAAHGQTLPTHIHVLLGDGTSFVFR